MLPILQKKIRLEVLSLYKYQLQSLDFLINGFCMKLFRTTDIHVVAECQAYFGLNFDLPSVQLASAVLNFWTDIIVVRHLVVKLMYVYLSLYFYSISKTAHA